MNEGAWIRAEDGEFWIIDEHADWMKNRDNADKAGLPESVSELIAPIRNDYSGENRKRILLAVMDAGFIRFRGHESVFVFEFTVPIPDALRSCRKFLEHVAGEWSRLRFNDVSRGKSVEFHYGDYEQKIDDEDGFVWLTQQLQPLVPLKIGRQRKSKN